MTSARDEIVGSIRKNLAASRGHDDLHSQHSAVEFDSVVITPITQPEIVAQFIESLSALGVETIRTASHDEAAAYIGKIIGSASVAHVAISNSELVANVVELLPERTFHTEVSAAELFDFDIGVTSAQGAIADTGTLVLASDREDHRLVSLVPPVHICLLEADRIRATMGEILAEMQADMSQTFTFVTGASRTSDIELTLAIGVHGPGELHVIILDRA